MIKEAIYFKQLKKYERRLNRNQIEIAHFIPGRIRLKSERWKHNEHFLQKLKTVIEKEPFVNRVNFEVLTGSLLCCWGGYSQFSHHRGGAQQHENFSERGEASCFRIRFFTIYREECGFIFHCCVWLNGPLTYWKFYMISNGRINVRFHIDPTYKRACGTKRKIRGFNCRTANEIKRKKPRNYFSWLFLYYTDF